MQTYDITGFLKEREKMKERDREKDTRDLTCLSDEPVRN